MISLCVPCVLRTPPRFVADKLKPPSLVCFRQIGAQYSSKEVDRFMLFSLFATVTNVNFDGKRIAELVKQVSFVTDSCLLCCCTGSCASALSCFPSNIVLLRTGGADARDRQGSV